MDAPSMYEAALVTLSTIQITAVRSFALAWLTRLTHFAEARIFIQHPNQSVAQKLGEAFPPGLALESIPKAHVLQLSRLFNDIKVIAARTLDSVDEVSSMSLLHAITAPGNGDATTPVSDYNIQLDWIRNPGWILQTGGYVLSITVPYDEDRYGNLYKIGIWAGSEDAGIGRCATCTQPRPEFQCNACGVDMYCGAACQTEAWEGGHDKDCACS